MKSISTVVTLLALILFISSSSEAKTSIIQNPQPNPNFIINTTATNTNNQNAATCSFTVDIITSCYSVQYTRDQISLAFGDAYGNQVYAPRIDDPTSRTFESCSSDTFEIYGPCTYQICYLYLYRSGYDGWLPERVDVYGYNTRAVSFNFNVWIPADVWYGLDYCSSYASHSLCLSKVSIKPLVSDGNLRSCFLRRGGLGGYSDTRRDSRVAAFRRIRVGSWNVGSLTEKLLELVDALERCKVDIACFHETKWKGSSNREANGYKFWYSGSPTARNEVGVILNECLKDKVVHVNRCSDRIISLTLMIDGTTVNVISAYAPQVGLSEVEKTTFWDSLDKVMREYPTSQRLILGGDLNGHIGAATEGYAGVYGGFGLSVLAKLQEALDEEDILADQILTMMHRYADRFTNRRVEINNLMVLQDHPLVDYGKYAIGCMTWADMKKYVHLKSVRDELLRNMEEKRQLMANYKDM
nr:embryo-specific protein ATS3B-like [Tanacetum cinerariifolium]